MTRQGLLDLIQEWMNALRGNRYGDAHSVLQKGLRDARETANDELLSHLEGLLEITAARERGGALPQTAMQIEDECSFCGIRKRHLFLLVAGPRGFICDVCTEVCARCIVEFSADVSRGQTPRVLPRHEAEGVSCSFCAKDARTVSAMVAGPQAAICSECVQTATEIIEERRRPKVT